MSYRVSMLKKINKLFPLPKHPFNMENDGELSYGDWQFLNGEKTIDFYLKYTTKEEMFRGNTVLDIGCGAGGKTLYYASLGAEKVYGMDIVRRYEQEAINLAKKKNLEEKFEFVLGDASSTNFNDNTFDTIIMNDAMEHVDKPVEVLDECYRILKKGGKLYINFPPYYHPFGAHLSDAIGIPWVHIPFSDKTLINAYKDLVIEFPDGERRIDFRISKDEDGKEYFSYLNKMTISRFKKIDKTTKFKKNYYSEEPLRSYFSLFAKAPIIKECFVKMVVVILEK